MTVLAFLLKVLVAFAAGYVACAIVDALNNRRR